MHISSIARIESSEAVQEDKNKTTPVKAKIKEAIEFCEDMSIPYFKKDVFQFFGVKNYTGWRSINQNSSRRHHNDPEISKTRGRRTMVSSRVIREKNRLLQTEGIEERNLTWEQLGGTSA